MGKETCSVHAAYSWQKTESSVIYSQPSESPNRYCDRSEELKLGEESQGKTDHYINMAANNQIYTRGSIPQQSYVRQNSQNQIIETRLATSASTSRQPRRWTRTVLKMVVNLSVVGFISFLVSLCFWEAHSRSLTLATGKYIVNVVAEAEGQHCQPCAEVMSVLSDRYHSIYPLSMDDLMDLYEVDKRSSIPMCCTKTPGQIMSVVDTVFRLRANDSMALPVASQRNKVAFHAVLLPMARADGETPRVNRHHFLSISKNRWSSADRDFTFCIPGTPATSFCQEIGGADSDEGIQIPFNGYFTIRLQVGWVEPSCTQCKLSLRVSRKAPNSRLRETLARDDVHTPGNCSGPVPCASGRISQTFRLQEKDQIFIAVFQESSVSTDPKYTFLEIEGESIS